MSLGRMDQYLYPYFKADMEGGRLTLDDALELIMCLYIKLSEGDESQMLMVGGMDEHGNNVENELSVLLLEAQTYLNMRQPSLGVRICEGTSEKLLQAANDLVAVGSGMPAYFNDDVIIKGLKSIGVDHVSAANYGIVGCYEAAPQGSFSNTVHASFTIYDSFEAFISQNRGFADYDSLYKAYKDFFRRLLCGGCIAMVQDPQGQSPGEEITVSGMLSEGRLWF